MRIKLLAIVIALTFVVAAQTGVAAIFGGYECTDDCAGHAAGYKWAEEHNITEEQYCPEGYSSSFHEGCIVYTNEPYRGATEDDDGGPIEEK